MLTLTSLIHPTMIAKVRLAMRLAGTGRGHEMNGHANRTYITNRKGRNIIRCSYWKDSNKFQFWGDQGRDITPLIKAALAKAVEMKHRSIIPMGGIKAGMIVVISAFTSGCAVAPAMVPSPGMQILLALVLFSLGFLSLYRYTFGHSHVWTIIEKHTITRQTRGFIEADIPVQRQVFVHSCTCGKMKTTHIDIV